MRTRAIAPCVPADGGSDKHHFTTNFSLADSLWMLHSTLLQRAGFDRVQLLAKAAADVDPCGSLREHSLYRHRDWNHKWDPSDALFVFHARRQVLPAHTWVEVTHCDGGNPKSIFNRSPSSEAQGKAGSWMFWTPGSGVWFNLGNTSAFATHNSAVRALLNGSRCHEVQCTDVFPTLAAAGRARGLNSLQILQHADQRCGNLGIEILDLEGDGSQICGSKYRAGWAASRSCVCDNSGKSGRCANCASPARD